MKAAVALYNRFPVVRPLLAGMRGSYLRWWRYGGDTERLVAEAIEREYWPAERWREWQGERLRALLRNAAANVPYYRHLWSERRGNPECLENWPVLEKDSLRATPRAFLTAERNPRWMFSKQTSGTTGKPLQLWTSRAALHAWYALFEARCRRWHGLSLKDAYAMLGGQLVAPASQSRPPFWVWNAGLRQLYLSGLHISPGNAPHYAAALRRRRVRYILGFPSLLNALAQGLLQAGISDLRLGAVLANGEPLLEYQRRAISEAFHCPVRETYGMGEAVAGASECEHGRLHLWPDAGILELLDEDRPVPPGAEGAFICTGLTNPDMPLIRYRIGDCGVLDSRPGSCPCGRTLPVVARISGRTSDLLYTPDGRVVYWLNPVFYGLSVVEAQIVQEQPDAVRVRYVESPGFSGREIDLMAERLRDRLGNMHVEFERTDRIPRGPNGKFQPVVCLIAPQRQSAGAASHPS